VPPPFSFNNTYNYQYISGYYYITFMSTGNFIPTTNISNAIIVAVGGGGGGGGGEGGTGNNAGAGGAGGGAGVIEGVSLSTSSTYTITVGTGGVGGGINTGGSNGTTSSFSTFISSSGGNGGYTRSDQGNGDPVIAGTTTVSGYPLYGGVGVTGNGGNGGYSDVQLNYYGANGSDSEIYGFNGNTGYQLPNGNNIYFSGGGGGGKSGNSSFVQGGTPGNGYGGSFGYGNNFIGWPLNNAFSPYEQYPPLNSLNGLDAVLYGAGGGGGSENQGGNGANGIVMVIFPYP
jgi:hypothetical protein